VRGFARIARATPAPAYALGGVDIRTARRLSLSGAAGLAAVEGLT
jgi:thiamine-phosphate pyrophosphorylase